MEQAIVEARGLTKRFFRKSSQHARHFDAVSKVDVDLCPGEVGVLMGRSGCGKTTLLNMLAGLLVPTEGTVLVCGTDVYALDDAGLARFRNETIGVVPQGNTLLHSLSVVENVALPLRMYARNGGSEMRARAWDLLVALGVETLADAYPAELSGGEAKRVCIARALVCQPRVVLADEPTADLDDGNTELVLQMLKQTARNGAAVLIATHEPSAREFADISITMDAGCIL